LNIFFF